MTRNRGSVGDPARRLLLRRRSCRTSHFRGLNVSPKESATTLPTIARVTKTPNVIAAHFSTLLTVPAMVLIADFLRKTSQRFQVCKQALLILIGQLCAPEMPTVIVAGRGCIVECAVPLRCCSGLADEPATRRINQS